MAKRNMDTHLPIHHLYSIVQETLAIQLYAEHRAIDNTVSWFKLSLNQKTRYRKMAGGTYKLPTSRQRK